MSRESLIGAIDIQGVIDAFPYYVMIIDEEHTVLAVNHAITRQMGALQEDLLGKYCPTAIHGMTTPFPGCPLELAALKGEDVEHTYLDEENKVWVKTCVYPTGYETGEGRKLFLHTVQTTPCEAAIE